MNFFRVSGFWHRHRTGCEDENEDLVILQKGRKIPIFRASHGITAILILFLKSIYTSVPDLQGTLECLEWHRRSRLCI